ncbi:MAG: beta-ketoacyl-ACP synthase II [Gammaproteobacteria bacterium]|nr:beta-ketoacyl-ACP synthase II [Gammaproteobacteria bacterium]MYJ51464.1 beta-ketoacyl-ACP synthase II [Gammaproteobacteria bacterium]
MTQRRRVVVTGMSAITPVGSGLRESWQSMLDGANGIGTITLFDPTGFPCMFAGEVKDFDPSAHLTPKDLRKMDRFIQFGIVCGMDAIADSGIEVNDGNADRIGVYIGSGIGGIKTIEDTANQFKDRGPRRVSPFYIPMTIINMISGNLSIMCGLRGPNLCTVTACSTGTHSIGEASRLIEYGDVDIMVAGGAEAPITPTSLAGFASAKALSTRNDAPACASRPWDRDRDGFVIGEGAGVLVLEEYEHARARGARIYAELLGFGMSGDAYHMTGPSPGGEGASRCMDNAMRNAGLNPEDVDCLNAHGTSTPLGDIAETLAVKSSFGSHAGKLAISSNKSMIGHLLGAAGGVEAVMTAMSIYEQTIPPTINLENPDPQCDLDYVPNEARSLPIRVALSNSFGFGGTNGTLAFGRI